MRDPVLALDLDLGIARRARQQKREQLDEIFEQGDEGGGFFAAVITLLSE